MNHLIAKTPMDQKLAALIEPELAALGFELVRIRFQSGNRPVLQIMAEREGGGMEIEDCAQVSTALSALLDVEDPIEGEYTLEISSPGIDRPLTRLHDFDDWKGYEAKIALDAPLGGDEHGQKRFRGQLHGTRENEIRLKTKEGEQALKFDAISEAKLIITDELIRESLRRGTARMHEEPEPQGAQEAR